MASKHSSTLEGMAGKGLDAMNSVITILGDMDEYVQGNASIPPAKKAVFQSMCKKIVDSMEYLILDAEVLEYYMTHDMKVAVSIGMELRPASEREKYFMMQKEYLKKEGKSDAITLASLKLPA